MPEKWKNRREIVNFLSSLARGKAVTLDVTLVLGAITKPSLDDEADQLFLTSNKKTFSMKNKKNVGETKRKWRKKIFFLWLSSNLNSLNRS